MKVGKHTSAIHVFQQLFPNTDYLFYLLNRLQTHIQAIDVMR
jgi:hypothetical protein